MTNEMQSGVYPVPEETVLEACHDRPLPKMGTIRQKWRRTRYPTTRSRPPRPPRSTTSRSRRCLRAALVAVGAGSRGINNLPKIVRGVVGELQERGYEPFVFPAMGSHGGRRPRARVAKLDALGVNEETVGCEIRATMDTVEVGRTPERDILAVADANAAAADAIIPINRVKAHTDFQGEVESGLSKMLVIGMGKQRGAKTAHEWSVDWSLRDMLPEISTLLREELPPSSAAWPSWRTSTTTRPSSRACRRRAFSPARPSFSRRPTRLCQPSRSTNWTSRRRPDGQGHQRIGDGHERHRSAGVRFDEPEPERPDVKRIYVRSLTDPSHRERDRAWLRGPDTRGPPRGDGHFEVAHQHHHREEHFRGPAVPAPVETDRAGFVASLSTVGVVSPEEARGWRG